MKSPLRYPGGKTRAVKHLEKFIPEQVNEIASPFFGGGSFELHLNETRNIKIKGYDLFKPLASFWEVILKEPEKLADKIEEYHPLEKEEFYELQKSHIEEKDKLTQAAEFFVLNRASFSGVTLSGGMSKGHPRFNQNAIDRVRNFKASGVEVECLDFKDSIQQNKDTFLYLDPPYYIKEKLYGKKGDLHENFDHIELYYQIRNRKGWILSYNDHPFIRELYKDFKIVELEWTYGMNKSKQSTEILIISE